MKKEIFSFTLAILAIVFGVACDTDQPNPNPTTSSDVVANTDTGPQPAKCDGPVETCPTVDAGPTEPDTAEPVCVQTMTGKVKCSATYCDLYWTISCTVECRNPFPRDLVLWEGDADPGILEYAGCHPVD